MADSKPRHGELADVINGQQGGGFKRAHQKGAGGVGTIAGVVLGTLFLRVVIDSVAKLFRSQPDLFEGLVVGSLVVMAVAFNALRGTGSLKKQFFPGALGLLNVLILAGLSGTITAVTSTSDKLRNGTIAAVVTFLLLSVMAVRERMPKKNSI